MKFFIRIPFRNCSCNKLYKSCILIGWLMLLWNVLSRADVSSSITTSTRRESSQLHVESTANLPPTVTPSKTPIFVPFMNGSVYVYSSIAINSTSGSFWNEIELNGWEHNSLYAVNHSCCVVYDAQFTDIDIVKMVTKRHWYFAGKSGLDAKQIVCPNTRHKQHKTPVAVSLIRYQDKTCPKDQNNYIKVGLSLKQPKQTIGVCAKLVYGNIRASDVIEWFEYQRLMKVDKIVTYTFQLNKDAMAVLDYYTSIGIGEHYPFDLPETEKYHRSVGVKKFQSWNDEQITVFDCQGRLTGYTYIGLYDVDEYIHPKQDQDYIHMLTNLRKQSPHAAGFTFKTEVYATTWGEMESNNSYTVTIGKYIQRTAPFRDRVKSIIINERLKPGRLSTHGYGQTPPFRKNIVKEEISTLKHYRSCRKEWMANGGEKCYHEITKVIDKSMLPVAEKLEEAVNGVKESLHLN